MKCIRAVMAGLLCCLLSGVVSAENTFQPKAESDTQPKAKKSSQPKPAGFTLPKSYAIRKIKAGIRKEFDTPEARDICSGFTFSEAEVREYFKKASVISEHVRQYGFQNLPCYVGGEMILNGEVAAWEIEASAAGKIRFNSGKVMNFGCGDACRKMFDGK